MAASLYSFLGWALYLMWRDLQAQTQTVPVPALTIASPDGALLFRFTSTEVTIGRDAACECCLEDPTISARHALLSYHHHQWWVEDLKSRNGTYLNQSPVDEPMVLANGDQLRCGQVILELSIGEAKV
jgi:pSer/pThr/pTyr-binding forkhead associated (FHA) protein